MKLNPLLTLLAVGALALAGCSSTPTQVDHGPIAAKSFSFVNRGGQPLPAGTEKRQLVHAMIQNAITRNLSGRGVAKVETGGDVTVAYLLIVGNNTATASINDYFGYSEDATALANKAHDAYTGSKNPNNFQAGTLLIDLVDSRTYKLLKRGYATQELLQNVSDDTRAAHVQAAVDQILRDVKLAK